MSNWKILYHAGRYPILFAWGVFAAFSGFLSPFFYLISIAIIYPIIVCIQIESAHKNRTLNKVTKNVMAEIHIYGSVVKERIRALSNIEFTEETRLFQYISSLTKIKLSIIIIIQTYSAYSLLVFFDIEKALSGSRLYIAAFIFGVTTILFLHRKMKCTLKLLRLCKNKDLYIFTQHSYNQIYYSAFIEEGFDGKCQYIPYMDELLKP